MLIRSSDTGFDHPVASDITPREVFESRRTLLQQMALGAAGLTLAGWAARDARAQMKGPGVLPVLPAAASSVPGAQIMDKPTAYKDATTYNNFYEFGTDKGDPAEHAHTLRPRPWSVLVDGEVGKPQRLALEDLMRTAPMEERIYRLRCVEGWSMVIPWIGFSLSALAGRVEPTSRAKFVSFYTLADAKQMPGVQSRVLDWPYVECLRIDEAMHPLTLLAFGLYGEVLPNQNGAPVRLVVPWKYGFKSAKSIVRIQFTEKPVTPSWVKANPQEYGFYSNVNPRVDHPRWSQATERRIGEGGLFAPRKPTLMFNGYEAQVGQLYAGLDLKKNY